MEAKPVEQRRAEWPSSVLGCNGLLCFILLLYHYFSPVTRSVMDHNIYDTNNTATVTSINSIVI